jgi:hypothetical protein
VTRSGVYRGRLEADDGVELHIDLRLQFEEALASADFYRQGNYLASLRTKIVEAGGGWQGTAPRVIFDWQQASSLGGSLSLQPRPGDVIEVSCVLPEAVPTTYTGSLSFDSAFFRVLNIEVDKLTGMPWPPELSTSDVPSDRQPPGLEVQDLSIADLFRRAGVDARVQHNEGFLDNAVGGVTGRPGEEDRWDEREMHEMMEAHYGRNLNDREWWLYLLVVARFDGGPMFDYQNQQFITDVDGNIRNDGEGTMGIIFDHTAGQISDPWSEWLPRVLPQFRHLFDFGRSGAFHNARARQGAAVFWTEFLDFFSNVPAWDRDRRFLRTIVHELGHALNLAHTWLVNRADSTSFMQYPQRYPHGINFSERDANYWRNFDYNFDPEELFHFIHGFYNEVVPGGTRDFMDWTPSSVFHDPTAGGTRANIALSVRPGARHYRFMEPVTLDVEVVNHGHDPVPVGELSPSFGNVRYLIRRPDGAAIQYRPPLYKCELTKQAVERGKPMSHTTSLAVGAGGFTFDSPGQYEIVAALPDPSTGAVVVSEPAAFWVGYPTDVEERIASRVFDRESALFLYMGGGEHLERGKSALEVVADEYKDHPFAAHANLVLGLNALNGQKSVIRKQVAPTDPTRAAKHFETAQRSGHIPSSLQQRLKKTIELCNVGTPPSRAKSKAKKGRNTSKTKGKKK